MDTTYADTQTLWSDLSIALRAIPAILYGEGINTAPGGIKSCSGFRSPI